MTAMPMPESQPISPEERDAKRCAIAEARASVKAEGTLAQAAMTAWLKSWGAADEAPPPIRPCK